MPFSWLAAAAATAAAQPIRGACHVRWASLEPRGSRNSRGKSVLKVMLRVRLIPPLGWHGVGAQHANQRDNDRLSPLSQVVYDPLDTLTA